MRLAKALIRLRVCAGWSGPLLVVRTTLLEISCHGFFQFGYMGESFLNLNFEDRKSSCFEILRKRTTFCGCSLAETGTGLGGFMVYMVLCPGAQEGSTGSGSGLNVS